MINILNEIDRDHVNIPTNSYVYNDNINVPRVTEILSSMLHEDYLMKWSNSLGYRHQSYTKTLDMAADKGTIVHAAIENYISNNILLDIEEVPFNLREEVNNAFQSFLLWWIVIKKNDYKVIMQEEPLVCEHFGGTLDLLIEINGKIYLMDFKTSNHPSYKYFLQMSAYRYMLKNIHNIDIDAMGIIMLDKKEIHFREIIVDLSDESDRYFTDQCLNTFFGLVYSYYNRLRVENLFKDIERRKIV